MLLGLLQGLDDDRLLQGTDCPIAKGQAAGIALRAKADAFIPLADRDLLQAPFIDQIALLVADPRPASQAIALPLLLRLFTVVLLPSLGRVVARPEAKVPLLATAG